MRPKNGQAREAAQKEIEAAFGFVPRFYEAVPEVAQAAAWSVQRDLELAETTLDNKTKELIGLAVAAHIKCRYCIYFHTEAARAHGATDAQLREAAAMGGMTAFFSDTITGAQVDYESFQTDVDRAVRHISKKAGKSKSSPPAARRH